MSSHDDLVIRQRHEIEMLQEKVRQLQEVLAPPSVRIPVEWRLTASERRVFVFLTTRELATTPAIMQALYSDRADEPDERIVAAYICKLRKKLTPFGIRIQNVWGQGYSLADRQKARVA